MEYSKDIVLNSRCHEVNTLKNTLKWTSKIKENFKESKMLKFVLTFSILCVVLIAIDIILIYNFANILQTMV